LKRLTRLGLATTGVLLIGAVVRLVGYFRNPSLSGDEAMLALSIGRRSFRELLQPLDYGQVAPVPFVWAERALTLVGGMSSSTLRLIPLLAGIALLWGVYRVGSRLLGPAYGLVAMTLAATAFPLIRYSVEVKPYVVDAAVSVSLIWMTMRLLEDLEDANRWLWLAVAGSAGVLVSTPALFVCTGIVLGIGLAVWRTGNLHLVLWIALVGVLWGGLFGVAYVSWYAPNVEAPYMRTFWAESFLSLGRAGFPRRLSAGVEDLACTLTCWRGAVSLAPLLLLLSLVGLLQLIRWQGWATAIVLGGPIAIAFAASALGRYPVATRLLLFSGPLLALLAGTGAIVLSKAGERVWPRIRSRWIVAAILYPSVIVAAALTFSAQSDGGFEAEEIQPLARLYEVRGNGEPIYVFPRAVPAWVFHTTDWSAPDTARLAWVARAAGPDGLGFVNGASRGRRAPSEGANLVYTLAGWNELYGTTTGAQGRVGVGYQPPRPDPGWSENEARRIRAAAEPYVWLVFSDYAHGALDERAILMDAVSAAGGEVVFTRSEPGAVLYRVRFQGD
jgi:hypothetical protein